MPHGTDRDDAVARGDEVASIIGGRRPLDAGLAVR